MDVAGSAIITLNGRLVQPGNEGAQQRDTGRIGGPHDQGVAARLGNDGGLERGIGAAGCLRRAVIDQL